jgi:rhomboid protease GluP
VELPGEENICNACLERRYSSVSGKPKGWRAEWRDLIAEWQTFPATYTLIILNLAVFVLMLCFGVGMHSREEDFIRWGGDFGPLTTNGQWWRLITSTFVHAGVIHLSGNMGALGWLGPMAERQLGPWKFLLIYLSGGLCASLTSQLFHFSQVAVGASGAIFAIAGFLVLPVLTGTMSLIDVNEHPIKNLLKFAAYNLLIGVFVPFINNAAHAGGFVYGLLVGAVVATARKLQSGHSETATP